MNKKFFWLLIGAIVCCCVGSVVFAVTLKGSGIGGVAEQATKSLKGIALLVTAGSYVAGMGFAVGAIAKFKAHKDNPTQVPISMPIALLFVAAALIFIPSVFKTVGGTLYGASGQVAGVSGITTFGT
jgi:intracellular multiplication protein IcmD